MFFNVFEAMRHDKENPHCYQIDVMEEIVKKICNTETSSVLLDRVIVNSIEQMEDEYEVEIA